MSLSSKILLGVAAIVVVAFSVIGYLEYRQETEAIEWEQRDKAKVIQGVLHALRSVYQQEFLENDIPINEKTLGLLPAHAISRMSAEFSAWSVDGLTFNNVSDRPRNPENQADAIETEAMQWFREHPDARERITQFSDSQGDPFYHFSSPLRVVSQCLRCHGAIEDAPATVRERYNEGYDYAVGDLRGILSVKLPAKTVEDRVNSQLLSELAGEFAVLLAVFGFASLLLRRLVLRRLERLDQAARRVATGIGDVRVADDGNDEIAGLAHSFNRMSAAVDEREQRLRDSEARYLGVLNDLDEVVFRTNQHGHWQFLNRAWEGLSGYTVKESIGRPWTGFVHPDDLSNSQQVFEQAVSGNAPSCRQRTRFMHRDGSIRHTEVECRPIVGGDGAGVELAGTIHNLTEQHRAEADADAARRLSTSILENINEGFLAVDADWRVTYANPLIAQFGIEPEALIGEDIWDQLPELSSFFFKSWRHSMRERSIEVSEGYYPPLERWLEARSYPFERGLAIYFFDQSQRREAERELRLAGTVFDSTREGVLVTDASRHVITINPAFTRITGYSKQEVLGRDPKLFASGRHDDKFYQAMWASLAENDYWSGEVWNRRKNGEVYPQALTISVVRDANASISHYVSVFSDITALKESQQRLSHQSHHDALTGLPNRLMFQERLGHGLKRAQRQKTGLAVIFLDLDRFKNVNDGLGHPVGDELLQQVGERLCGVLRADDTLARLGGDEFILLLEGAGEASEIATVAEKLLEELGQPFLVDGHELFQSASIGISLYPDDGEDVETLIKNADAAMYRAKDEGRNSYQFWTTELTVNAFERHLLETQLRRAIERDELELYYQPQVCGHSLDIVGVEALVRWNHPDLGVVGPDRFIPLAEESDLIQHIGQWVLKRACRQLAEWNIAGIDTLTMAVNLSSRQVVDGNLAGEVAQMIGQYGIDPEYLELEITEGSLIRRADLAQRTLIDLKNLGVNLAIDDFGTGYSALGYLKRFSVDTLKIDRSFVRDIPYDEDDMALARAVVAMGRSLHLKIIAEGVETEAQRDFLRAEGCDQLQGYLFGRPMQAAEIARLLLENGSDVGSKRCQ